MSGPFARLSHSQRAIDRAIAESLFLDQNAGVALLDRRGTTVRSNQVFRDLAGILTAGATDRGQRGCLGWRGLPDGMPERLQKALDAGQPARLVADISGNCQYGPARRVLILTLIPATGGGALLLLSDRTHERELEEQLAQSQRLQAVGTLAGGIAHDFNNLLTAILGGVDELIERARDIEDREELALIRASADRGAALVRQLLAFGRQQTLQPRVLGVNAAITSLATLLRRLLSGSIRLHLALEEPSRQVLIDPIQLDQVLLNLAVNAGHAMPRGGDLTIRSGHRLLLAAEKAAGEIIPAGRYASIEVADTGHGMEPETLARIFEPFFTTRRETGGSGLGLSTVHGIVRQSGGFLSVESRRGIGTVFRILLPRHESMPWEPEPTAPRHAPGQAGAGRTILLVEDEQPVLRLAQRALAVQGWNILAAASGEEALEMAGAAHVLPSLACVVSDVVMPGLDGPSLIEALRETSPHLPAILVSGYADRALRERLAGDDIRFLAKPFAMRDLAAAVQELCPLHAPSTPER